MNVSLKQEWSDFIEAKVKSGEYDTASEVVRAGLRLLKREDERERATLEALQAKVQLGLEQLQTGQHRPADELLAGMRARLAAHHGGDQA